MLAFFGVGLGFGGLRCGDGLRWAEDGSDQVSGVIRVDQVWW